MLKQRGIPFEERDITQTPPSKDVLERVLASGYEIGALFNRSGELYRELRMKDKIAALSRSALLDLLATHGKLIKRPIITDGTRHVVGFDEARIRQLWRR